MPDTQIQETAPPGTRRTYTTRELAEAVGLSRKDVQNALEYYTITKTPIKGTKQGRVLLYMREHGITPEDIVPMPRGPAPKKSGKSSQDVSSPVGAPLAAPSDARPGMEEAAPMSETEGASVPEPAGTEESLPPVPSPFVAPSPLPVATPDTPPLHVPEIGRQHAVPAAGVKHDVGKLRLDLIPPEAMRAMGDVLTYGADKYGDRNWEKGISADRVYAALLRHLLAWREGEATDPESGLPHLAHALTNAGMLVALERRKE